MNNPTEPGVYTTIFKDGSIVLYNEWLTFENPELNKWYFNETERGGVIHWFKPECKYNHRKYYKIPDFILRDFIKGTMHAEACYLEFGNIAFDKALNSFLEREHFKNFDEAAQRELDIYWKDYKI